MYAEYLTKKSHNTAPVPYLGTQYRSPISLAGQGQGGGMINTAQGSMMAMMAAMMRMPKTPKSDGSYYGYIKSNPDSLSSIGIVNAYKKNNPERWRKIQEARADLHDAGGGWFNFRGRIKGSMDPRLMLDAIMATPRMDDKMKMIETLRRDGSPSSKKALELIRQKTPGLIRPELKEKFLTWERGTSTEAGNIDLLNNIPINEIPGNKYYRGPIGRGVDKYMTAADYVNHVKPPSSVMKIPGLPTNI